MSGARRGAASARQGRGATIEHYRLQASLRLLDIPGMFVEFAEQAVELGLYLGEGTLMTGPLISIWALWADT